VDGKTLKNPSFNDFYPAIKQLLDGIIKEYAGEEIPDTFDDWESRFSAIKKKKEKIISEIEGAFNLMGLSTGANDKKLKAATLNKVFNVLSLDKLEDLKADQLKEGLSILSDFANAYNIYMKECEQEEKKPDNASIGKILEDTISDHKQDVAFDKIMA
jgi:hypothetical protein